MGRVNARIRHCHAHARAVEAGQQGSLLDIAYGSLCQAQDGNGRLLLFARAGVPDARDEGGRGVAALSLLTVASLGIADFLQPLLLMPFFLPIPLICIGLLFIDVCHNACCPRKPPLARYRKIAGAQRQHARWAAPLPPAPAPSLPPTLPPSTIPPHRNRGAGPSQLATPALNEWVCLWPPPRTACPPQPSPPRPATGLADPGPHWSGGRAGGAGGGGVYGRRCAARDEPVPVEVRGGQGKGRTRQRGEERGRQGPARASWASGGTGAVRCCHTRHFGCPARLADGERQRGTPTGRMCPADSLAGAVQAGVTEGGGGAGNSAPCSIIALWIDW